LRRTIVLTQGRRAKPSSKPTVDVVDHAFTVSVTKDGAHRVVHVGGELDLATRNEIYRACLAGGDVAVMVEMADLTFMDCSGYSGLAAARRVLQEQGGSLTLRNQVGQPARLLTLLSFVEARRQVTNNSDVPKYSCLA
jgi:anti-anti-sigma factor